MDTLENYDSIIVTYSGYLNETAAVEVAYKNTTKLTHTDVNAETASATTTTTTYEVVLEKKGNGGVALAGAEFVLMNSEGKYYQMTAGKVAWVDSVDAATKQVSAVAGGKALASFIGVDAGDYKLVETKAPNGYITPTGAAAVTSTNAGSTYVDHVSTITNVLGEPLPETGGIGTTIFYIIGGVLVAGAVVLLITKKRMTSAE